MLQCVPYARIVSGVDIHGDALNWWDQADGRFQRGHRPKKGAVLAFRAFGPMALGHVAVVSRVLDDRRILIRHANWSAPGAIEEDVLAIDVSALGDWSQVRVWHSPTAQMGARIAGFRGFGEQMLRIDMAERMARTAHETIAKNEPFTALSPQIVSLGLTEESFLQLMRAAGFRPVETPPPAPVEDGAEAPAPSGANWAFKGRQKARGDRPQAQRGRGPKPGGGGKARPKDATRPASSGATPAPANHAFAGLADLLGRNG